MAKLTMKRLADFSEWQAAEKRDGELRGQLAEVERRISALHGEYAAFAQGPRTSDIDSQARGLLQDSAAPTQLWTASAQEELSRCQQERTVLVRAIEMHTATMNGPRARLSREACQTLVPAYRAQVEKLKELVRTIGETNDSLHAVHMELEANGFSSSALTNMEFLAAGRASDEYSRAHLFLEECKRQGF